MNSLIDGIHYFLAGFKLITKPGLKRYVVIPLILNIFVFVGLFSIFYHYVGQFNIWLQSFLPSWLHFLSWLVGIFFIIGFFLFFIYAFVVIGNIVCAPFNSFLSEKVELYLTGNKLAGRGFYESVKDIPRIFGRQLLMLGYYVVRALLLFFLFFIPIVHPFIALLWFLLNAWFMALSYMDFPMDNHGVSFQKMRAWLNENRWAAFGFGASMMFASMIPILNFFAIPAAVAGATQFWVQAYRNK